MIILLAKALFVIVCLIVILCIVCLIKNEATGKIVQHFITNDFENYKKLPPYDVMLYRHPFKWTIKHWEKWLEGV